MLHVGTTNIARQSTTADRSETKLAMPYLKVAMHDIFPMEVIYTL